MNHAFFWDVMQPAATPSVVGQSTQEAVVQSFGSWVDFKKQWEEHCTDLFGSGWVWLVYNLQTGKLELTNTKDQVREGRMPRMRVQMSRCVCVFR